MKAGVYEPSSTGSAVRIGIDVGGTFTKGVALDTVNRTVIGQARLPTTHDAPEGVVAGVLAVLAALLKDLPPAARVNLVAHATTQATNALLEGDVARVGLLALGPSSEAAPIRRATQLKAIPLSPSRSLDLEWAFIPTDGDEAAFEAAVRVQLDTWHQAGIEVVAVNQAFAPDDPSRERRVAAWAFESGLPATAGCDLSGVYGLELRASTSAVNASILPIMLRTASHVETALHQSLPGVPLLIVRGDGGAVDLQGLREAPIHTVVSGPAASLAGAVLHAGVADGVFFEVGGTSTNVGAIRGGRPVMKHMTVMDFPTALRAADIRIAGVAGGSLLRLKGRRIEEVGPRSAHIAGLPYSAFADPAALAGARLELVSPRPGDPAEYAVIGAEGGHFALTPTCAANALALLPPEDDAHTDPAAARLALAPLAAALGADVDRSARAVLEASAEKLLRTVSDLAKAYDLAGGRLYGGGGGARVLGPVVARRLGMTFSCVPDAEVISSIGAALTLIRVEREVNVTVNDPTVGELLTREVEREAVRLGANPARLQTELRYLPEERLLRAVAVGAHPVDSLRDELSDEVLRSLARAGLGSNADIVYSSEGQVALQAETRERGLFRRRLRTPVAVYDRHGARLLTVDDAQLDAGTPADVLVTLQERLGPGLAPHLYALTPRRLIDCGHLSERDALLGYLEKLFRLEAQVAVISQR